MRRPLNLIKDLDSINPVRQFDSIDAINPIESKAPHHWYVIYTKPRSEDVAREELERKEVPVFLPRIRYVSFQRHRTHESIEPLFPNYLFARFTVPEEYYYVKWTRGVKRVLGNGHTPVPLDDSIVIFLKEKTNEKGLIQPEFNLKYGDRVRVRQGPLQGLWGIVQGHVDAKGRVRVLMDILRSGAVVELPYSFVERCR
jgi:transcriptional antiterminator RfaH